MRRWHLVLIGVVLGMPLGLFVAVVLLRSSPGFLRFALAPVLERGNPSDLIADPTAKDRFGHLGQDTLFLSKGQALLIRNSFGTALIQITDDGDGFASYRWRFKPPTGTKEETGSGRVFELYKEEQVSATERHVVDVGSNLTIVAGPFSVQWSSAGSHGGWVYLNRERMGAQVLSQLVFESFPL